METFIYPPVSGAINLGSLFECGNKNGTFNMYGIRTLKFIRKPFVNLNAILGDSRMG